MLRTLHFLLPLLSLLILLPSCSPPPEPHQAHPVILVHGIFDSGKRFGTLKRNLEKAGYECHTPNLKPKCAAHGLAPLQKQLGQYMDKHLPADQSFHLVGYSMGGVIARSYLSESSRAQQCLSLSTLATPHHGSYLARLYPCQGGRDLSNDSAFIQALNKKKRSYHKNTLSIRNPIDGVILPSTSSELAGADNQSVTSPFHPFILINKKARLLVLQHLQNNTPLSTKTNL